AVNPVPSDFSWFAPLESVLHLSLTPLIHESPITAYRSRLLGPLLQPRRIGQLGRVPPAAQRLEQRHRGGETPAEQDARRALVAERRCLDDGDVQEAHRARLVLVDRERR